MASLPALTPSEAAWIQGLIETGREHLFYVWSKWLAARDFVLAFDRYECQLCKSRGRYGKAALVHHVNHLKRRPDLALSLHDETGNRQLVSLCFPCHVESHPERARSGKPVKIGCVTAERWD